MTTQENRPLGTPRAQQIHATTPRWHQKPVAYCTVPVPYAFKTMVEGFSEPEHCQVKVAECDGTREALAALFRDDAGWRAPNIKQEAK